VDLNLCPTTNVLSSYNVNYVTGDVIRLQKENTFDGNMDIVFVETLSMIDINDRIVTGAKRIDKCYFPNKK